MFGPVCILNAPAFSPLIVTVWSTPPTYTVTFVFVAVILVAFTSIFIVLCWFPFASFTTTLVFPCAFGEIVRVDPFKLTAAISSFAPVTMLNAPAFVPPNVTVLLPPPTYAVTLVGLAVILVAFTSIFIVAVLFPFASFNTTLVVPAAFGVTVKLVSLILAVA